MNNTSIIILLSIFAIILLAGCTSQTNSPSNNVVQTTDTNKSTTQNIIQNTSSNTSVPTTNNTTKSNISTSTCLDKQCFITAANKCGNETIQITEDYGVVKYSISGCVFTKTIISLASTENADMKKIVEGKNMTCLYTKGQFDQDWTNLLVLGIEKCSGGLKDAIADLLAFA